MSQFPILNGQMRTTKSFNCKGSMALVIAYVVRGVAYSCLPFTALRAQQDVVDLGIHDGQPRGVQVSSWSKCSE